MNSPFASSNSIITMYLEPILHPFFQTYIDIITLSAEPPGPLADMVKLINFPKIISLSTSWPLCISICFFWFLHFCSFKIP